MQQVVYRSGQQETDRSGEKVIDLEQEHQAGVKSKIDAGRYTTNKKIPGYKHLWAEEVVLDDAVNRNNPVAPSYFLALFIGSSVVGDTHLVDTATESGNLCCNLRFKAKAVLLYLYVLDDFSPEDLVASLHVREVEVGEHIGEQGQEAIANPVPEIKDPVG